MSSLGNIYFKKGLIFSFRYVKMCVSKAKTKTVAYYVGYRERSIGESSLPSFM